MAYLLGLESSCDETAAAVVYADENGKLTLLSDVVASQVETHRLYGGVVPEIAGRAHIEAISQITYEALEKASVSPEQLSCVAVTGYPGLIGALLVAVNFAKAFALRYRLPLVSVDHIKGHVAAAYLTDTPPVPPFTALVTSGGHTSLFYVKDYTDYELIGQTRDDAIGESFDKIGRLLDIPYPAGAEFDRLADRGFCRTTGLDRDYYAAFGKSQTYKDFRLPSPALRDGSMDFSFSGLKTAAINLLHRFQQTDTPFDPSLFAAAYTYEAVEAVKHQTETALDKYPHTALAVAGGVAANSHLRAELADLCRAKGVPFIIPPRSLCGDNGAMIAAQGYYEYLAGHFADVRLNAFASDVPGEK